MVEVLHFNRDTDTFFSIVWPSAALDNPDKLQFLVAPLDSGRNPIVTEPLAPRIAAIMTEEIQETLDKVYQQSPAVAQQAITNGFLKAAQILSHPTQDDPSGEKRLSDLLHDFDLPLRTRVGLGEGIKRFKTLEALAKNNQHLAVSANRQAA
jgi:hypothetical protein